MDCPQPQDPDTAFMLIMMEATMKAALLADTSVLVLVETPNGRSWVGRSKLKEDFLNSGLQLEPDDNEYILNPETQSFLRQPSVAEQERNHQLFLNQITQQKQNRERITKKLMSAGAKRTANDVDGSVAGATTVTTPSDEATPLQLVALKKVKYHERKKSQEKIVAPTPSPGVRKGKNNGTDSSTDNSTSLT